jgi:hypothetical protein
VRESPADHLPPTVYLDSRKRLLVEAGFHPPATHSALASQILWAPAQTRNESQVMMNLKKGQWQRGPNEGEV